ncbi:MAG: dephospho-CoA kinase [Actinomycetota bacterium]|nr:dephospho-CoA kinase [Actinomycetota bacterium]
MILVALTGGIGSGKSSVSSRLADRGALIVDADAITRRLQEPGGTVFEAMVERFGDQIVATDGTLDRQAVAEQVFADADALADLNKIVHPAVRAEMARQVDAARGTDRVVVLDIPLLAESKGKGRPDHSAVIVVDTPPDVAVERLVDQRGFTEDDARARIANQASREDRLALADFVVDNSGDLDGLDAEVDRLWAWLATVPPAEPAEAETA